MLALIDESAPQSARGTHYTLGAAILLDKGEHTIAEERAIKLIGGRRRPFHWKDEGTDKRSGMIELLGDLEISIFAVVHYPVHARRQEVARCTSLQKIVAAMSLEGVDQLLIESRGIQDSNDRQTIIDINNSDLVSAKLSYAFAQKDNALIWLPDAIAGIVSEAECGKSNRWMTELQRIVPLFEMLRINAHEPRLLS